MSVSHLLQWVSVLRVGPVPRFFTRCPFVISVKPLTDDEILNELFNEDSDIEDFDDSDADVTFSSKDEIDDSDDKPDDDAPCDAPEGAKRPIFWKPSSR